MRKLAKIGFSLLILLSVGALYAWDSIVPVIKTVNESNSVDLVSISNYIGEFFKYADAWNLIFISIFLSLVIILLAGIDLGYGMLFRWLSKKYHFLEVSTKQWFWPVHKTFSAITVFLLFIVLSNMFVAYVANRSTVYATSDIDNKKPVLLLGTSKMLSSGKGENLYYRYRINAVADLYKDDKIEYVIISGDKTDSLNYDETRDMTLDLIKEGIPAELIEIDTAGYRTLDSMLRLRELFKLNEVIIVSQEFHTQRALFLSWFYSIDAIAYPAAGTSNMAMVKREVVGAKPKVILDLLFFNTMPKSSVHDYREGFKMNSNVSVLIVIFLFGGIFSSFWLLINILENRVQGIYYKIGVAVSMVVGTILLSVSVYKNTDIEFVDNVVSSISEKTGILSDVVKKKEEKKKIVEKIEAEIEFASLNTSRITNDVNTIVKDIILSNKSDEVNINLDKDNLAPQIDNSVDKPTKLTTSLMTGKKNKETSDKNLLADKGSDELPEKKVESAEEKPEKKKSLLSSVIKSSSNSSSGTSISLDENYRYVPVKVHGTQVLNHEGQIQFRLDEDVVVKNMNLVKNKVFTCKANVFGDKASFRSSRISVVNIEGSIYENRDQEGINLSRLLKDKKNNYVLSDGMKILLRIKE